MAICAKRASLNTLQKCTRADHLLIRLFAFGDVEHDALPELTLTLQFIHQHDLVMYPNQVTIARDHSIFHFKWFFVLICGSDLGQYLLMVLRVQ